MENTNHNLTRSSRNRCFGGWQDVYKHYSPTLDCEMNFGVYLPPQAEESACPILYWLSGLTCSEQNFITKAGAQQYAAKYGLIIIAPDTSPRGCNLPHEEDDWDLGTGAGFYLNATQSPWSKHYQMYDYIISELPSLIESNFPIKKDTQSIFGHSMGGHGALVIGLRNSEKFASISAFSPVVAPSQVPWGKKAFQAYLGDNKQDWLAYDATYLVQNITDNLPILIDIGEADPFLDEQLKPELFVEACATKNYPLTLRKHPHYDHSYYFISSFIGEHFAFHAEALKNKT